MDRHALRVLLLAGTLGLLQLTAVEAATSDSIIRVATNGVDSGTCGAEAQPCRTISQALLNASDGQTILVGPGRYGDLNRNGTLGEAGEESAGNPDVKCMVNVDRSVAIYSQSGASVTTIDAGPGFTSLDPDPDENNCVVRITVAGVTFGAPGHGFTIDGRYVNGILLSGGSRILGNTIRGHFGDYLGFGINLFSAQGTTIIADNIVTNLEFGIEVDDENAPGNVTPDVFVFRNRVTGNLQGIDLYGNGLTAVTLNVIANNGGGISMSGDGAIIHRNAIVNNDFTGVLELFRLDAQRPHRILGNGVIGNGSSGISFTDQPYQDQVHYNDIYGNGESLTQEALNCGVYTEDISAGGSSMVDATQNFWGTASGPGANPADDAGSGSACQRGALTVTTPFAAASFSAFIQE